MIIQKVPNEKRLEFPLMGENVDIALFVDHYQNGPLYIGLSELDPDSNVINDFFGDLTKNLPGISEMIDKNEVVIDTNNLSNAGDFIKGNNLGEFVKAVSYNWGRYEVWRLNMERLKEICLNPELLDPETGIQR